MCQTTQLVPSVAILGDIYKSQQEHPTFAFDRDAPQRALARLQKFYAEKLAEYDEFHFICEMGSPEVVVRLGKREVVIPLPDLREIHDVMSTKLEEGLRKLEMNIVQAHLDIENDARERDELDARARSRPESLQDYVPQILALCQSQTTLPTA